MSDFQIDTERLLVRRFTPMDGSDFAEMLTDPETVYYEPYEVLTREQAVAEAAMLSHNPAFQTAPDGTPIFSDYCFYAILKKEFL